MLKSIFLGLLGLILILTHNSSSFAQETSVLAARLAEQEEALKTEREQLEAFKSSLNRAMLSEGLYVLEGALGAYLLTDGIRLSKEFYNHAINGPSPSTRLDPKDLKAILKRLAEKAHAPEGKYTISYRALIAIGSTIALIGAAGLIDGAVHAIVLTPQQIDDLREKIAAAEQKLAESEAALDQLKTQAL